MRMFGSSNWRIFCGGLSLIVMCPRALAGMTVYDLNDRYQVPGQWALARGTTYRNDGETPHWRGIYDDRGRIMVAMCFNQDNGDAWEWADSPHYPEKFASQAFRTGINYIIYSMTH